MPDTKPLRWKHGRLFDGDQGVVMVGAEIHNSSASTSAAIARAFDRVAALGAAVVLAPVTWEQFEPVEGEFDTTLIDRMLADARDRGLQLLPLWFGAWKNGSSSYAPEWVLGDRKRFPRSRTMDRGEILHVTPFAAATVAADARAFRRLVSHIRDADGGDVVRMIQVENEVGLLGDSRDRSTLAEAAWTTAVPTEVIEAVATTEGTAGYEAWVGQGGPTSGSWGDVFGPGSASEELFMVHAFASALERITGEGRAEWDIPMFTNGWLDNDRTDDFPGIPALAGGQVPGVYPSGGPVSRVASIWRALAPSLDAVAPDIYFGDFADTCRSYSEVNDGRLLIPETRRDAVGLANMFVAVGDYGASLVAPFGVDSLDPGEPEHRGLQDAYALLNAVSALHARYPDAETVGFTVPPTGPIAELRVGGVTLVVDSSDPYGTFGSGTGPGFGLAMATGPSRIVVIGRGFHIFFRDEFGSPLHILAAEELSADRDPRLVRRLNGDETAAGTMGKFPALGAEQSSIFPIPYFHNTTGVVSFTVESAA